MRIMQIIPDFDLAGAEVMCENLSYDLIKQGQEVLVISLYNKHTAITERIENAGIKIVYLDKSIGFDISIFKKLRKLYKIFRPDVIHTHLYSMLYAVPASIGLSVKRIHTVHNIATKEVEPVYQRAYQIFYRFLGVRPVALSKVVQDTMIERYKLRNNECPIVFNGIDLDKCIEKENYNRNGVFKILHVGRFSPQKNHNGLIKAFAKFHELHNDSCLELIGDGELKPDIEKLVEKLGINDSVIFYGLQKKVYNFMHDADVFILPSNYEGMPITLIEAMATGLPIVATNVGGIPDMIKNDDEGVIVENNINNLTNALTMYYEDFSLRKKHGQAARKKARKFSSLDMAEEYLTIYQS